MWGEREELGVGWEEVKSIEYLGSMCSLTSPSTHKDGPWHLTIHCKLHGCKLCASNFCFLK